MQIPPTQQSEPESSAYVNLPVHFTPAWQTSPLRSLAQEVYAGSSSLERQATTAQPGQSLSRPSQSGSHTPSLKRSHTPSAPPRWQSAHVRLFSTSLHEPSGPFSPQGSHTPSLSQNPMRWL